MKNIKRVLAWIAIVLIVGLVIASLVSAFIGTPFAKKLCVGSLATVAAVSIVVYFIQMFLRLNKHNTAVINPPENDDETKKSE